MHSILNGLIKWYHWEHEYSKGWAAFVWRFQLIYLNPKKALPFLL